MSLATATLLLSTPLTGAVESWKSTLAHLWGAWEFVFSFPGFTGVCYLLGRQALVLEYRHNRTFLNACRNTLLKMV